MEGLNEEQRLLRAFSRLLFVDATPKEIAALSGASLRTVHEAMAGDLSRPRAVDRMFRNIFLEDGYRIGMGVLQMHSLEELEALAVREGVLVREA